MITKRLPNLSTRFSQPFIFLLSLSFIIDSIFSITKYKIGIKVEVTKTVLITNLSIKTFIGSFCYIFRRQADT
ncbi:unknown [Bacteroides faecis CAG:32]|nr:unknown [Bacteroides faecis CAG:32]